MDIRGYFYLAIYIIFLHHLFNRSAYNFFVYLFRFQRRWGDDPAGIPRLFQGERKARNHHAHSGCLYAIQFLHASSQEGRTVGHAHVTSCRDRFSEGNWTKT